MRTNLFQKWTDKNWKLKFLQIICFKDHFRKLKRTGEKRTCLRSERILRNPENFNMNIYQVQSFPICKQQLFLCFDGFLLTLELSMQVALLSGQHPWSEQKLRQVVDLKIPHLALFCSYLSTYLSHIAHSYCYTRPILKRYFNTFFNSLLQVAVTLNAFDNVLATELRKFFLLLVFFNLNIVAIGTDCFAVKKGSNSKHDRNLAAMSFAMTSHHIVCLRQKYFRLSLT